LLLATSSYMKLISALILCAACGASSTSSSSISAIALSPNPCGVAKTGSTKMTAEATFPDGTKEDLGSITGTWSSANTNTATVNPEGIVVGVNVGITSITLAYRGASGSVNCTVAP
jgi:hypothetical protein